MNDIAGMILRIHEQQLGEEACVRELAKALEESSRSVASAKEEISQLMGSLQIAVNKGFASPEEIEAVRARLNGSTERTIEQSSTQNSLLVEEPVNFGVRLRKGSLIDMLDEITASLKGDIRMAEVRQKLQEADPDIFSTFNPASISGTLSRLADLGVLERVGGGGHGNSVVYRRAAPAPRPPTPS